MILKNGVLYFLFLKKINKQKNTIRKMIKLFYVSDKT